MRRSIVWATLLAAALAACSRPQVRPDTGAAGVSAAAPNPAAAAGPSPAPAPASPEAAAAATSPGTPAAAATPARGDTLWVDVRTPAEYAAGHVAGALLIPYDQMEQRWTELERYRARPIVLYCRSGHRAGIALKVLEAHGFTTASNGGGFDALRQRGVPAGS